MLYILIPTTEERRNRLDKLVDSIHNSTYKEVCICTYENWDGGYVKPLYKMMEGLSPSSLIFFVGDDCVLESDCLQKLMDAYNKLGNGYIYQPDDSIQNGFLATSPMCDVETMKKYLFKGYIHYYSDNEIAERAAKDGKYVYVKEAKLNHEHPVKGFSEDETYKHTSQAMMHDKEMYLSRKKYA